MKLFDIILAVFTIIMSESDELTYTEESSSIDSGSESSSSDEIEVVASSSLTPKNLYHIRATKVKTMKLTKMVLLLPHYVHDFKAKLL